MTAHALPQSLQAQRTLSEMPLPEFGMKFDVNDNALPFRILVTGWRFWPARDMGFVHEAIRITWAKNCYGPFVVTEQSGQCRIQPCVVVDGHCPYGGVDLYAHEWATKMGDWGVRSERHAAETVGGKLLGPDRNSRMVNLGAHVALAFPGPSARGTIDCMKKIVDSDIRMITLPYQSRTIEVWRATGRIEVL